MITVLRSFTHFIKLLIKLNWTRTDLQMKWYVVRYLLSNSPGCLWCLVCVCLKFAATRVKKESLTFLNFNNKIFSVKKEKLQVLWNFVLLKQLYLSDDGNEFVFDLLYPKCKPLSGVTPTELAAPNCRVCTRSAVSSATKMLSLN